MTDTITFDEIGRLLGLAAARDQRTIGDADVLAWHDDLNAAGINFTSARHAITRFYAVHNPSLQPDKRWRITAVDVIDIVRRTRRERTANFRYEPPPDDTDPAFLDRYRAQLAAVASGKVPAPSTAVALEGGPHPAVVRELEARGWQGNRAVPAADDEPDVAGVRRPGPLGQKCPKCSAPVGRPCRLPGLGDRPGRERAPHPARIAIANGQPAPDPEAEAAEIKRRREASAAYLARLEEAS